MNYARLQTIAFWLQPAGGARKLLIVCLVCVWGSGCASIFSKPVMSSAPQSLAWLANLATAPIESAPAFDLAQIQPATKSGIAANDMLEITIWDLYEPGKPHTFPTRVDTHDCIVVPHLDPILVKGAVPAEVESRLSEAYRSQDMLKQPRILVRELASAPLHIYVTGAVLRPGLIDLPPHDPSVFAALVAAGGLSRGAGLHVFVSERASPQRDGAAQASVQDPQSTMPVVVGNGGLRLPTEPTAKATRPGPPQKAAPPAPVDDSEEPMQLVNHSEPLKVAEQNPSSAESGSTKRSNRSKSDVVEAIATRPDFPSAAVKQDSTGHWYDLSVERDRDSLKHLVLRDGDMVTVRPAAPPVRITGAVSQPGSYRAPATNALTLLDAIQLAGGFTSSDMPMSVVLTRPATAERGLQRWSFRMGHGEKLPANMPSVLPGDLVHAEPTARARVQSLVDSLLPGHRT
jgi:protein involved in polysaccharide export with SLBB domain